jgi:hypothetical protein
LQTADCIKLDHSYSVDSNCVDKRKSDDPSADVLLDMTNVLPELVNISDLNVENMPAG